MDNRRRFLYRMGTELRGRGREARAGDGKTGISAGGGAEEKPRAGSRGRDMERKESSEARGEAAEKSRYGFPCARTVNRHRWMRRES